MTTTILRDSSITVFLLWVLILSLFTFKPPLSNYHCVDDEDDDDVDDDNDDDDDDNDDDRKC